MARTRMQVDVAARRLPVRAPLVKECACGRSYTADEWRELKLCGVWTDDVEVLVLRDCHCGSTIAIVLWTADRSS
jgi:hypothetical protein